MLAVTTGVKWPPKSSSSLSADGENWNWPKEWAVPGPCCPLKDGPSDEEDEDDEEDDEDAIGINASDLLGDDDLLACRSAAAALAPAWPGNSTRW